MSERNTPFQEFFMRHAHLVARVVSAKCPKEEVADVAMKVWGHVQRKWPLDGVRNVEAYLTRCAQNQVKMFLRDREAQKRPPVGGAIALPDEAPSGANLDERFVIPPELTGKIDGGRLTENFLELGEELSGDKGELMARFLEHPSGVSRQEFRKLAASATKNLKRLGEGIDPLKEGPSFVGHVAAKIRNKRRDEDNE